MFVNNKEYTRCDFISTEREIIVLHNAYNKKLLINYTRNTTYACHPAHKCMHVINLNPYFSCRNRLAFNRCRTPPCYIIKFNVSYYYLYTGNIITLTSL